MSNIMNLTKCINRDAYGPVRFDSNPKFLDI